MSSVSRKLRRNASHWEYRYQYADALAKARAVGNAVKRRTLFIDAMREWAMARLGWDGRSASSADGRGGRGS